MSKFISMALIVPAFKPRYLKYALDSIERANNLGIKVYVFDDAGPEQISELVRNMYPSINYYRFENNLGSIDLAGHWNRCVRLTTEDWIYVFSDDDVLGEGSLDNIEKAILNNDGEDIYSLAVTLMDENEKNISNKYIPNSSEPFDQFALLRLKDKKILCCGAFLYKRSLFDKIGGYVSMRSAWHSDEITYYKMIKESKKGFSTLINGAEIKFRQSGLNISSDGTHQNNKLEALKIAYEFWKSELENISCKINLLNEWRIRCLAGSGKLLPYKDILAFAKSSGYHEISSMMFYLRYLWEKIKLSISHKMLSLFLK